MAAPCVCCLILLCAIHLSAAKDVLITDGATLMQYLCPGNRGIGTLPPNTNLVLSKPQLNISTTVSTYDLCKIENTTNLTIAPSQDLFDNGYQYVEVGCFSEEVIGFGFFNVTNLTMSSIVFINCHTVAFPPEAMDKLLQFYVRSVVVFFNYCFGLKLYNVSHYQDDLGGFIMLGLGVNLCGTSEIINLLPESEDNLEYPSNILMFYFKDSIMTSEWPECNLTVISNTISSYGTILRYHDYIEGEKLLDFYGDLVLFLTQSFVVNVTLNIGPYNVSDDAGSSMGVVICFINSAANSHVILKGYDLPYDTCLKQGNTIPSNIPSLELAVIFYETQNFNPANTNVLTSLLIRDTAFVSRSRSVARRSRSGLTDGLDAIVQITKLTRKLSHKVLLENVSWCYNDLFGGLPTLLADNSIGDSFQGKLHLKLTNIFMQNNNGPGETKSYCLVCFSNNVEVMMTGTNYFANNTGGSVLSVAASNLTVSGDLTIEDGYAYKGGAIILDGTSTLFLREPLVAKFYNNAADKGSAIYAPVRAYGGNLSSIQLRPSRKYSLSNVTTIAPSLQLHFESNSSASLYAPYFSFFGNQTSPDFAFEPDTWDHNNSQYAYTTLIDAILHMDEVDKFTSLSNGLCVRVKLQQRECYYIDENVKNSSLTLLPSTEVYPGQVILSVLNYKNSYNRVFDIRWGEDETPYHYSNVIPDGSNLSILYNYENSFNDSAGHYVIMLTKRRHQAAILNANPSVPQT